MSTARRLPSKCAMLPVTAKPLTGSMLCSGNAYPLHAGQLHVIGKVQESQCPEGCMMAGQTMLCKST